jgi:hypothetical protein
VIAGTGIVAAALLLFGFGLVGLVYYLTHHCPGPEDMGAVSPSTKRRLQ